MTDTRAWDVRVVPSVGDLLAREILDHVAEGGTLFASGGSTGPALLSTMTHDRAFRAHLRTITLAQVDERVVPSGSEDSNWHVFQRVFLDPLTPTGDLPSECLPILTPTDEEHIDHLDDKVLESIANRYESKVARHLSTGLVHLGIGPDGHIASLFPNSRALDVLDRDVTWNFDPSGLNRHPRITLTYRAIARARRRLLCVQGASKAAIIASLLEGAPMPAQDLARENTVLIIDTEAASIARVRGLLSQEDHATH
jgi:6-phosphogluconolactonase/glucosamine-6-phosphate isomerase/deaminase